jgi:hypothetical protein
MMRLSSSFPLSLCFSGSVLSSRILGLSSFLTTLLLSVKISDQSVHFPGSSLHSLREKERESERERESPAKERVTAPHVIEDPVVQLVMQFLTAPPSPARSRWASASLGMPSSALGWGDLTWASGRVGRGNDDEGEGEG